MKNKTVLITGATDGIGKQTALEIAKKDATVILHGRNTERLVKARDEISRSTGNSKIEIISSDLSSLTQVKTMGNEINSRFNHIDILINNAGVYNKEKKLTNDGYEITFTVNHLAHFLLTNLLLDLLNQSGTSRIINVSSVAHTRAKLDFNNLNSELSYDAYNAYAVSKLANVFFTYELANRMKETSTTVNALHPGVISTKLLWEGFNMEGNSLSEGAETSVYLAASDEVEDTTGKYFVKKKETPSSEISYNVEHQSKMWNLTKQMIENVIGEY